MRGGVRMQAVGIGSAGPVGRLGRLPRWGSLAHATAARARQEGLQHPVQVLLCRYATEYVKKMFFVWISQLIITGLNYCHCKGETAHYCAGFGDFFGK